MFSIIMPLDENRLNQFKNTKLVYDSMPQKKEFIIPTRNERGLRKYFSEHKLDKDVRIIPYVVRIGFNCSKALNLGVRSAKYPQIIVTSPEVLPITQVLAQFEEVLGTNVVGQVWDGDENGNKGKSLVSTHFRNNNPGMYFLAMFNKDDIEKVNGWDEEFMKGYAYEDKDFGERFRRAGIPFTVRDDIQALHQYHPRSETIPGGLAINRQRLIDNHGQGIIKCKNGLLKLKEPTFLSPNPHS